MSTETTVRLTQPPATIKEDTVYITNSQEVTVACKLISPLSVISLTYQGNHSLRNRLRQHFCSFHPMYSCANAPCCPATCRRCRNGPEGNQVRARRRRWQGVAQCGWAYRD